MPKIGRPVEEIYYIGDLDRPGLRIVRAARRVAELERLPEIRPPPGLHAKMLETCQLFGAPLGWPHASAVAGELADDENLAAWLPASTRMAALSVIQSANRIPEEILGPAELSSIWGL